MFPLCKVVHQNLGFDGCWLKRVMRDQLIIRTLCETSVQPAHDDVGRVELKYFKWHCHVFTSRGRLKIFYSEMPNQIYKLSQLAHNLTENRLPYVLSVTPPHQPWDDLLFPLIVINHIWKNSHGRSADWWQNTRSHLLSKCCQGQVDWRGRAPARPGLTSVTAHHRHPSTWQS